MAIRRTTKLLRPPQQSAQIELNQDHWLADSLYAWYPQMGTNNRFKDYSTYDRGGMDLLAGTPTRTRSQDGNFAEYFGGGAEHEETTNLSALNNLQFFTVGFWCKSDSVQTGFGSVFTITPTSGATDLFIIYIYDNYNGARSPEVRVYWDGVEYIGAAPPLGDWINIVFSVRQDPDRRLTLYINGESWITTSDMFGQKLPSSAELQFGHWNGGQNASTAHLKDVTVHTKVMTPAEVKRWYIKDRWGLYKNKLPKNYIPTIEYEATGGSVWSLARHGGLAGYGGLAGQGGGLAGITNGEDPFNKEITTEAPKR